MFRRVTCEKCNATVSFDDSKSSIFCANCGNKILNKFIKPVQKSRVKAINQYAVNGTKVQTPGTDKSLYANLIISYVASNPSVKMLVRFTETNETVNFTSGKTQYFNLRPGAHIIFFMIGNRCYNRSVVIHPNGPPIRIDADWVGRAHIYIR